MQKRVAPGAKTVGFCADAPAGPICKKPDIVIGLFVNRYAFGRPVQKCPSPLLEHYQRSNSEIGAVVFARIANFSA